MTKLTTAQQLWVDALRSGEYQQTKGCLQDNSGYCCLGVACAVAAKQGIPVDFDDSGNILGGTLSSQQYVKEWLGITSDTGWVSLDINSGELTTLNDKQDYTFPMLADFIEEHADDLFGGE